MVLAPKRHIDQWGKTEDLTRHLIFDDDAKKYTLKER